jgi:hypothetical protein
VATEIFKESFINGKEEAKQAMNPTKCAKLLLGY